MNPGITHSIVCKRPWADGKVFRVTASHGWENSRAVSPHQQGQVPVGLCGPNSSPQPTVTTGEELPPSLGAALPPVLKEPAESGNQPSSDSPQVLLPNVERQAQRVPTASCAQGDVLSLLGHLFPGVT